MKKTQLFLIAFSVIACLGASQRYPAAPSETRILFDGHTLNGWTQAQNNETSFSGGDIRDVFALSRKLLHPADAFSRYFNERLDPEIRAQLAVLDSSNYRIVRSGIARTVNAMMADPELYDSSRFGSADLRPSTLALLEEHCGSPAGIRKRNRKLIEDRYPEILERCQTPGWIVEDGAMSSTGSGRGVIYTNDDFGHYRLMFSVRHMSGNPDHRAGILIFCTRPADGEVPQDALGGVQFQVPNGGHWDYRPGKNNSGKEHFDRLLRPGFDEREWSRVEILVNASKGTARMAVAHPIGTKAVEVLRFEDPEAGRTGPIAWQMHNAGLFDQYKDVVIETDPAEEDLITVR